MSMNIGGGRLNAAINVTPMIDVLLVLLVIFMVVTPISSKGLGALVPQPPDKSSRASEDGMAIVITVSSDDGLLLNQTLLPRSDLSRRLAEIFKLRPHAVVFVRAAKDIQFRAVASVIDEARNVGFGRVGLLPASD